jgi:hypothetical protein
MILNVDRLYTEYGFQAFVKLDTAGADGWSCMSPDQHSILYDHTLPQNERIAYVNNSIQMNVIDEHLPIQAVVEEYADYTVCGLLIHGEFFSTLINLCGTDILNNTQLLMLNILMIIIILGKPCLKSIRK